MQTKVPAGAARCPLCDATGGDLVWRDTALRVVLVDEPDHPGFARVIWNSHVAEMTDLEPAQRDRLMDVVWRVERVQRETLAPDKINLASLGNVVPHLHWHVIPRWRDDCRFPSPVWSPPAEGRESAGGAASERAGPLLSAYRAALVEALR